MTCEWFALRTNHALNPAAVSGGEDAEYLGRWGWSRTWLTGQSDGPIPAIKSYARFTAASTVSSAGGRGIDHYGNPDNPPGSTGDWVLQPVTPGESVTLSNYLRHNGTNASASTSLEYRVHDGGGNWLGGKVQGASVALAQNEWRRPSVTFTVPAGGAYIAARTYIQTYDQTTGDTIDVTGLLIERSSTVGDWFSGDSVPYAVWNCPIWTRTEWAGTPNASHSLWLEADASSRCRCGGA